MSHYLLDYKNNVVVTFTSFVVTFTSKRIVLFFRNLPKII